MIRVSVDVDTIKARIGVERVKERLEDKDSLHRAISAGAEKQVRGHLRGLNSRSPNTNFYGRAADSVEAESDAEGALIRIAHRGYALRYYGGRVVPVTPGIKNLALPTEHVPVVNFVRLRPRDAGLLAFIPRLGGPNITTGYLVEGEKKTLTRGPNKGKERTVPKKGGRLMYVLRGWTDHKADASVLPTDAELTESGVRAARDYVWRGLA